VAEEPFYFEAVNDAQVVYTSRSRVNPFVCFMPTPIARQISEALDRLEASVGDIDAYVAAKLEWSVEEMGTRINSGQVDAVALIIHAADNDSAFLEADVTGFGKGRIVACACRYAVLCGKLPIFLTKSDNLFSDLWRDIVDIGSEDVFGTPFVVNAKVDIMDLKRPGHKVFTAMKPKAHRACLVSGTIPDDAHIVMMTYSQFRVRRNAQNDFVHSLLDARRCHFVMDEAQDFSSEDAVTNEVVSAMLQKTASDTFVTATAGKDIEYLAAYKRVFPWLRRMPDMGRLPPEVRASIAEASVVEAAASGRLIRREQDMTDLRIALKIDEGRRERDVRIQERQAPVFMAMSELDALVDEWVAARNDANTALMGALDFCRNKLKRLPTALYSTIVSNLNPENERHQALLQKLEHAGSMPERYKVVADLKTAAIKDLKEAWSKADIDSRLALLDVQLQVALLVDQSVDEAVQTLLNGSKPVVVLDSTMEGFLNELRRDGVGEESEAGSDDIALRPPNFRDVMTIVADRITDVKVRLGGSRQSTERRLTEVEIAELPAAVAVCAREISRFPGNIPLSPLDAIREGVESRSLELFNAGRISRPWTMGEISGRVIRVQGDRYETIPARERDRNFLVASFNQNAIDGLILTKKGSTGLSIHDTTGTPRHMIIVKAPASPKEFLQMIGRVRRTGQASEPTFSWLGTTFPRQQLILANQNRKIQSISASVSGTRKSALALDIPDFLSPLGNEVAFEILCANRMLARSLRIFLWKDKAEADRELYFVSTLFRRSAYLPVAVQTQLFDHFNEVLTARINEGGQRLPDRLPGQWRVTRREILEPGMQSEDRFDMGHVTLTTITREVEINPFTRDRVERMIGECEAVDGHRYAIAIKDASTEILKAYLPPGSGTRAMAKALSDTGSPVALMNRRLDFASRLVEAIIPGRGVKMLDDEDSVIEGVIVSIEFPEVERAKHFREYSFSYVVPGEETVRMATLDMMMRGGGRLNILSGPRTQKVMDDFDAAPRGVVTQSRKVLDGNSLRSIIYGARTGCLDKVGYETTDGRLLSGIFVPRKHYDDVLGAKCICTGAAVARSVLEAGGRLFDGDEGGTVIYREREGVFVINVPAPQSRKANWSAVEQHSEYFSTSGRCAFTGQDGLATLTGLLSASNETLFYDGKFRNRTARVCETPDPCAEHEVPESPFGR